MAVSKTNDGDNIITAKGGSLPTSFPWSDYAGASNDPFPTYSWYGVAAYGTQTVRNFSDLFYNPTTGDGVTLPGTAAANTITFTTGNTTVNASDGANTVAGTTGNNLINSGSGADTITLTTGDNQIYAGAGANTITATSGNNIITSGGGADTITLTSGNNWIDAGAGANTIVATSGINLINTGDGADTITTGGVAGGGNIIHAGNGANTITTGAGDDIVFTGVNVDTVALGAGNDTVHIMGGADKIAGGAGNDTLIADFSAALAAVTVNATGPAGNAGNNSGLGIANFAGIENFEITSGDFDDLISTGDGSDFIRSGKGGDTVLAGGGADSVVYTMGEKDASDADIFKGGDGIDTLTLELTRAEWFQADVQKNIADYKVFLAENTDSVTDEANIKIFEFTAFNLSASEFEALNIVVDGVTLDPTDVALNDNAELSEDDNKGDPATQFVSVLDNDEVADLAYSVSLVTQPSKGILTFNTGSLGAPDGTYSFDPDDNFEYLADGETQDVSFDYEVKDAFRGATQATVTITVKGDNDRPIADAAKATLGEDDSSVLIYVSGSDVDTSDSLSFKLLDAPTDAHGNQYGSVQNNDDGTFTFLTGDNFQFLDAGETRDMTFNYVAIDDSATATDTSVAQTVTVAVTGADDSRLSSTPLPGSDTFLFSTADQSIFGTGDASIVNPTLPFLGGSWNESFSIELVPGASLDFGGTDAVVVLGETIIPAIPGITLSSPSLTLNGSSSGKVGLQPFFSMTGGDIDATIPIGAIFDVPRQVEAGETFKLGSTFLFGDDTNISTQSAEIEFGVDLVLKLAAQMGIDYSSSSFGDGGSFSIIPSFDIDEQFNIFTTNSGDVAGEVPLALLFYRIPEIAEILDISVAVPNVTTTGGFSEYGPGYDVGPITSSGVDEIASLSVDIDTLISKGLSTLSGSYSVPVQLGFEQSLSLGFDAGPLGDFDLASFNITADLLYSDLTTNISLLQDFSLELEDLPLVMILEDGSEITGLSLGDDITVTAPIGFDADVDGDADGLIEFTIDVDMDAVLTTMVSLGFDTTFTLGVLRAAGTATSDIFDDFSFSAFEGGAVGIDDDFLYYVSEGLVNETVDVFEAEIKLVGFEPSSTTEYFDVA